MSSTTASKPTGGLLGGLVRRATGTPQDRARKAKVEKKVPTIAEVLAGPGGAPAAVELPAGKVVATGADAAAAEKGRRSASRWMPVRIVVGCWTAPRALRAYAVVTELDADVAAAREAKDATKIAWFVAKQQEIAAARQAKIAKLVREVIPVWVPSLLGGWPVATAAFVALTALWFWLKKAGGSAHGVVVERLAEAAVVSLAWTILTCWWAGGVSAGYGWRNGIVTALAMLAVLGPLVGWAVWATKDDGTIEDNLRAGEAEMVDIPEPESTNLQRAVNEAITGLDPTDATKMARVGDRTPAPNGQSWSAEIDTRGIVPAERLIPASARTALAAKLRVGSNQLFPVVHKDNAAKATLTVITGQPFAEPVTSCLIGTERVDLWHPPAFFRDITGTDLPLPVAFNNIGIGGMPDFGKSTTLNALICMFLLGGAKVKVIDGGEVDTEPFHRAGLLAAWCRDAKDAIDLLRESIKEIEATQSQLAEMGKRKVDPEFFAETETSFELLAWDELEAYANHPDSKIRNEIRRLANDYISRCRKTGRVLAWATQSPSADGIDSNFRDKTICRIAHYCSTWQMSDKILGDKRASQGLDASLLPTDVQGVAWYLGRKGARIARPHHLTELQVDQIIDRLRRRKLTGGETVSVPPVIGAMAAVMREERTLTMGSTELLERLRRDERFADLDYIALADTCRPFEIRPEKIGGVKVYRLADLEKAMSWAS